MKGQFRRLARQELLPPLPSNLKAFDFESELAIIIGKPGRFIEEKNALAHLAGYSGYKEGSVRAYQPHNRQFGLGKNFEKSGGFDPWLMTPDEFGDYRKQRVITLLTGAEKQNCVLGEMARQGPREILDQAIAFTFARTFPCGAPPGATLARDALRAVYGKCKHTIATRRRPLRFLCRNDS